MDRPVAKYLLRRDPDHRFEDLFLIGPYDYGADQLDVNGYTFTGKPPEGLASLVSDLYSEVAVMAEILSLTEPTIYFASHPRFPKRIASFIGQSSQDPMIVLFVAKLIREPFSKTETAESFLLRIFVHELMHAHVELVLGDASVVAENVILGWEARFAKAHNKEKVLLDFAENLTT